MKKKALILLFLCFTTTAQSEPTHFSADSFDFSQIDSNKNGYIEEKELLNFQQQQFKNMVQETFKTLDTNQDNKLSEDELISYFKQMNPDENYISELKIRIQQTDVDQNGYIDMNELKQALQTSLPQNNQQIFTLIDVNSDKKISIKEFNEIITFFSNFSN